MKDKLRELAAKPNFNAGTHSSSAAVEALRDVDHVVTQWRESGREPAYGQWLTLQDIVRAAILDAEGDGGAVPVAVQTRYQGPNKTVNTDWRLCSFAHAQAVKDARCDVTEIRYLYTYPARSGVVSDEDVEAARRAAYAYDTTEQICIDSGSMRAALEHFAAIAQTVDVEAVREVILQLRAYQKLHEEWPHAFPDMELGEEADKLTAALQENAK